MRRVCSRVDRSRHLGAARAVKLRGTNDLQCVDGPKRPIRRAPR